MLLHENDRPVLAAKEEVVVSSQEARLSHIPLLELVGELGAAVYVLLQHKGGPDGLVVGPPFDVEVGTWIPVSKVDGVGAVSRPDDVELIGATEPWVILMEFVLRKGGVTVVEIPEDLVLVGPYHLVSLVVIRGLVQIVASGKSEDGEQ